MYRKILKVVFIIFLFLIQTNSIITSLASLDSLFFHLNFYDFHWQTKIAFLLDQ